MYVFDFNSVSIVLYNKLYIGNIRKKAVNFVSSAVEKALEVIKMANTMQNMT